MNTTRWQQLDEMSRRSYVTQVDLRELAVLTRAAMDLRMLVDAVRLLAGNLTINDERERFLDLISEIPVIEGELPA
jgi:hypothetical protein